jgi:hypothetical protein
MEILHHGTQCTVLDKTARILVEGSKLKLKSVLLAQAGDFSALDGKVVEFVLQKLKNVLSVTRDSTNGGML